MGYQEDLLVYLYSTYVKKITIIAHTQEQRQCLYNTFLQHKHPQKTVNLTHRLQEFPARGTYSCYVKNRKIHLYHSSNYFLLCSFKNVSHDAFNSLHALRKMSRPADKSISGHKISEPLAKVQVLMCFITWGHRASSWLADMRTNFTPSSLFEMEQAKLATCVRKGKKQRTVSNDFYFLLQGALWPVTKCKVFTMIQFQWILKSLMTFVLSPVAKYWMIELNDYWEDRQLGVSTHSVKFLTVIRWEHHWLHVKPELKGPLQLSEWDSSNQTIQKTIQLQYRWGLNVLMLVGTLSWKICTSSLMWTQKHLETGLSCNALMQEVQRCCTAPSVLLMLYKAGLSDGTLDPDALPTESRAAGSNRQNLVLCSAGIHQTKPCAGTDDAEFPSPLPQNWNSISWC